MPYLVMKRSDIPASVLQQLDLRPNTSQRKFPYEKVGQTKYVRPIDNDRVVIQDVDGVKTTIGTAKGLTAWFLTNVTDGTEAAATGTITTVAEASLVDGETFTISDGTATVVFEFDLAGGDGVAGDNVPVVLGGAATADDVRDAIIAAITGSVLAITAIDGGAATVSLTNDNEGTAGNVAIIDTVANAGFIVAGMAGGADADALTATEAAQNATDVLDQMRASGALNLGTLNATITTGTLTAGQVSDVLRILAGDEFVVPSGTQVEAASAFAVSPTPAFTTGTNRTVYETGALRISFAEGRLSKFVSDDFTYAGISGAAIMVYNDDGTLFTG